MAKKKPLQGLGILVTRPEHQSRILAKLIEGAGGRAIIFPTIAIKATSTPQKALNVLKRIPSCDWLFFVSANAVHYAAKLLGGDLKIPPHIKAELSGRSLSSTSMKLMPCGCKIAAIGQATQKALKQYNLDANLTPAHSSHSEALMSLLERQNMNKKKCMIIRGEGGREALKQALENCGAETFYADVYKRDCPASDTNHLISDWKSGGIDYVTAMSGETLKNLITLLGEDNQNFLRQTPLITVSKRIEEMAHNAGIKRVIVSKQPYNETLIDTLIEQTGYKEGSMQHLLNPK